LPGAPGARIPRSAAAAGGTHAAGRLPQSGQPVRRAGDRPAAGAGVAVGAGAVARALRSDPYQVIKSGKGVERERLSGTRQWLLAGQLAACALLVTASFVAVRGLVRSLQANYGFNPTGALLVQVDLTTMAGYAGARVPTVQKRLLDSVRSNPAVSAASLADWLPLGMEGWKDQPVFRGHATDLRPSRQAADATVLKISPGYFQA